MKPEFSFQIDDSKAQRLIFDATHDLTFLFVPTISKTPTQTMSGRMQNTLGDNVGGVHR